MGFDLSNFILISGIKIFILIFYCPKDFTYSELKKKIKRNWVSNVLTYTHLQPYFFYLFFLSEENRPYILYLQFIVTQSWKM